MQSAIPRRHTAADDLFRIVVEFVVCLVIAVIVFTTYLVEAFIVPSGSMSQTLYGDHQAAVCPECGFAFAVGFNDKNFTGHAVCPNCSYRQVRTSELPVAHGDRLLVFKQAYHQRPPRRWEVAVFRNPHAATQAYIKRVVGLPGELVQVRDGELYINGNLERKPLELQHAMSVLVYDTDFELPGLARWRGDRADTLWRGTSGRYRIPARVGRPGQQYPTDWLAYRHLMRVAGRGLDTYELPIYDELSYNPSGRREEEMNQVGDLRLVASLVTGGSGKLALRATDGREHFHVSIDPAGGKAELYHNGALVAKTSSSQPLFREPTRLEWSLVDRQVLLMVGEKPLFKPYAFEPSDRPRQPTSRPFAIGSQGLAVDLRGLKIYRDIYYTDPSRLYAGSENQPQFWGVSQPYRLAADEYFVLGDNSAHSEDSRIWKQGPAVTTDLLVGKPLVVHMPMRWTTWGDRRFQVPDFDRIRYIR